MCVLTRTLPAALLTCCLGFRLPLLAEEPPLITDRPDQTESAFTVPKGLFQIEGGWGYGEANDRATEVTAQAFPLALLRIGLNTVFELRIGVPGVEIERTDTATGSSDTRGLVDATVGFKVVIAEERGALPQTAFLGTLVIPSGDQELTRDGVDPSFRFVLSNTLSPRLSLSYNLGMVWLTEPSGNGTLETSSLFDWTVALGISARDRLGVFVEAFGVAPIDAEIGTATAFDTGATYLLTPRLQLDVSASVGLSRAAADWTMGLGCSFRFPRSR